jgi:hypothetical protein
VLRASVVLDYQNVHLTAHDVFDPDGAKHHSLIDPMLFAKAAIRQRNSRQRSGHQAAEVHRVLIFRGLPHIDHQWEQHQRSQQQAMAWRQAGVLVELRDLKYRYEYGADGHALRDVNGKKVPTGEPPVEKGIDVLCALACVREAARDDVNVVVLASRDTDLVPVLDEVHDLQEREPSRYSRIETASWFNPNAREEGLRNAGGNLRPTSPRRIWNTNLDRACYEAALDRRDYR